MRYLLFILVLLGISLGPLAAAVSQAADPASEDSLILDQRATRIEKSLRCVVCQNQSINDSRAPLAGDMRRLVRERLEAGASDQEVIDFMVDRYGNFVLMNPPLQKNTLLLWFGPFLFLILAGLGWFLYARQPRAMENIPSPLTDDEAARLREVLTSEQNL